MTLVVGLTGSIGMGKSTTARLFAEAGAAVWDADEAVRRLYSEEGAAVEPIRAIAPDVIVDGRVEREKLKRWIGQDPTALARIERVVHPLVAKDRQDFLASAEGEIVVLDIPLLYETGSDSMVDKVVVVTAPAHVQKERVLDRPGMTEERFESLLAKQTPDAEKRARADYVIHTTTVEAARRSVHDLMRQLRRKPDA